MSLTGTPEADLHTHTIASGHAYSTINARVALSNKNWSADGRVVFMPKMGGTQLHLGGSLHYADLQQGSTVRYRQRPLVHFTDARFVIGNEDMGRHARECTRVRPRRQRAARGAHASW